MKKEEGVKKEIRIQAKYMHVTLHKLENDSLEYWLNKGMGFRANTVACLVGLEKNEEEEKGLHAHIMLQFSTKQQLFRRNFVEYFGTDCVNISTRKSKEDLLEGLGYVSKTGNTAQRGVFTYRGIELETNPEVYRFKYQVKTIGDGLQYFEKVMKESMYKDKNIIKRYAKREDAIGRWLRQHRQHCNTLHKLAHTWHLDHANERKQGFSFAPFMDDPNAFSRAYRDYLKIFPEEFKKHLPKKSTLVLEPDYDQHEKHDLEVLDTIKVILQEAMEYGPRRPHKCLNLYLWSTKPTFGKTTLLDFFDKYMMTYRLPDDQYYVDYENDLYQVLVSDEAASFIKTKDYSHLKHIMEGKRVEFNRKGKEKVMKEDNPLIVLAENVSFDVLMGKYFPGWYSQEVMATRVLNLELRSRATLYFLISKCLIPTEKTKQLSLDV